MEVNLGPDLVGLFVHAETEKQQCITAAGFEGWCLSVDLACVRMYPVGVAGIPHGVGDTRPGWLLRPGLFAGGLGVFAVKLGCVSVFSHRFMDGNVFSDNL